MSSKEEIHKEILLASIEKAEAEAKIQSLYKKLNTLQKSCSHVGQDENLPCTECGAWFTRRV